MKLIDVLIRGDTPLLQNRFQESAEQPGATRRVTVQRPTPREEAEKSAYRTREGKLFFPGAAIGRLLREAGSNHKLRGSRKSAKYVIPAAVLVMDEAVILLSPDNLKAATDFEVDSRPVVIPATKGRIMRHRPRHDKWAARFTLRINENLLPLEFVQQLLSEGGQQIGIGDFRPEKGGPFGTFQTVEWKIK